VVVFFGGDKLVRFEGGDDGGGSFRSKGGGGVEFVGHGIISSLVRWDFVEPQKIKQVPHFARIRSAPVGMTDFFPSSGNLNDLL
jgi:hypothetical protein